MLLSLLFNLWIAIFNKPTYLLTYLFTQRPSRVSVLRRMFHSLADISWQVFFSSKSRYCDNTYSHPNCRWCYKECS